MSIDASDNSSIPSEPDRAMRLLGDAERLAIVRRVISPVGQQTPTQLSVYLNVSYQQVCHHVALLRVADILDAKSDGKGNTYAPAPAFRQRWETELSGSFPDSVSQ